MEPPPSKQFFDEDVFGLVRDQHQFIAVVMNKNEKMKKNRKLDVNEVVFSFRTSYRALVVVIFSGTLTNY